MKKLKISLSDMIYRQKKSLIIQESISFTVLCFLEFLLNTMSITMEFFLFRWTSCIFFTECVGKTCQIHTQTYILDWNIKKLCFYLLFSFVSNLRILGNILYYKDRENILKLTFILPVLLTYSYLFLSYLRLKNK